MMRSSFPSVRLVSLSVVLLVCLQWGIFLDGDNGLVGPVQEADDLDPPTTAQGAVVVYQPETCSAAQMEAIRSVFHTSTTRAKNANVRFSTPIMRATKCPDESWLRDYIFHNETVTTTQASARPFLGINVGCNKGLDAVDMARQLSQNDTLGVDMWKASMPPSSKAVCGVPQDRPVTGPLQSTGQVHCIEPMPSTVESLRWALTKTGYQDHILVTQAAVSNTSGSILFPSQASGVEGASLSDCALVPTPASCTPVQVYSMDDYLNQVIGSIGATAAAAAPMIDMLLIDAEGFDYEVLQGARQTLKRVRYLTFEVHMAGQWMQHSLVHAVEVFLGDFNCYWAGKGRLWRISDCLNPALRDLYEYKSWSNVACVNKREAALAETMEALFLRTIGHV